MHKITRLTLVAAIIAVCGAYADKTYIPKAPDYDDPIMWVTADGDVDSTGALCTILSIIPQFHQCW